MSARAVLLVATVAAVSACGALLGVDHDFGLVDGGDDGPALADSSTADAAHADVGLPDTVTAADSSAPDQDAAAAAADASDGGCPLGTLTCGPDAQPQICTGSGVWQPVGAPCTGTKPACLSGACVDCAPGDLGCNGQQPLTCDSTGTWQNKDAGCPGQACVGGACTGVCAPNALACVNTYWFVCNGAGQWQPVGTQC